MSAPGQSSGMAKHYGVELVGGSVKESNGVLGGFAKNSFARIRPKFKPGKETFEVVIEFRTGKSLSGAAGLLSCSGQPGFVPFFLNANRMIGSISSNGKTWDVAATAQYGDALLPQSSYRMRCTWNGSEYEWFVWDKASWRKVLGLRSTTPVFQESQLQLGNHRLGTAPFAGTIDLNKCYICIGGSLWWEGAKGAYRNANK